LTTIELTGEMNNEATRLKKPEEKNIEEEKERKGEKEA